MLKFSPFHILLITAPLLNYSCKDESKLVAVSDKIEHSVEYIDPTKALLNEDFEVCNKEHIFNYYNPERATYSEGKNGLRNFILDNYTNKNYTDSGYLNIHLIINCKGEAGRYKIIENDLNLELKQFNIDLKSQLFNLTTQLKSWNPNVIYDENVDSHMYISYKIENGNIVEILP